MPHREDVGNTEAGRPLALTADWSMAYAAQCGIEPVDFNGDGKLDLITEGLNGSELECYLNVSENPGRELRLKRLGELQAGAAPLRYPGRYRYFTYADVDGDGTRDLLDSSGALPRVFAGGVQRPAPAPSAKQRVYPATAATTLDAAAGDVPWSSGPSVLEIRAQSAKGGDDLVTLVRFPVPEGTIGKATLELSAAQQAQRNAALMPGPFLGMMSCQTLDQPWDSARATWQTAGAAAWPPGLLTAGGEFVAYSQPVFQVEEVPVLRWTVTQALRDAQQQGRHEVTFLLRVDYQGHYTASHGLRFCGVSWKDETQRPLLRVE